jgi:predicted peptidase
LVQQVRSYVHDKDKTQLNYLLFLPKNYTDKQKWPLIFFLHGAGERGSDPELLKQHGIPKVVEEKPDFEFIAVAPQCPLGMWWPQYDAAVFDGLLNSVIAAHSVDTSRLYLTGISMGGYGTWHYAIACPDRFAAVVPICGGGDPFKVCALKDVPVWVFHGARDSVVLPRESVKMVDALKECGGKVKFTLYSNSDHDSWTRTYNSPRLYEWMLEQKRGA